jgi:hypothetical protein
LNKTGNPSKNDTSQAHRPVFRSGVLCFCCGKDRTITEMELIFGVCFIRAGWISEDLEIMLVERGLQVMNVEVVGDAYAIASNYLRKTGAITDTIATNDTLLEMIVQLFQRGEFNRIRLANQAIARFEDTLLV